MLPNFTYSCHRSKACSQCIPETHHLLLGHRHSPSSSPVHTHTLHTSCLSLSSSFYYLIFLHIHRQWILTCKWHLATCIINNNKGLMILWRKLKKSMIFLHFSNRIKVHIVKSLDSADTYSILFCNLSVWGP